MIDKEFIAFASNILGDTDYGLSGSEICKYFADYAVTYRVAIPYSSYPDKNFPNKKDCIGKKFKMF